LRKSKLTVLTKVESYHCCPKNFGNGSVGFLYPEYAVIFGQSIFIGSIPNNSQTCAVSEVQPLEIKFVNVIQSF
jgi:hypothetical protein